MIAATSAKKSRSIHHVQQPAVSPRMTAKVSSNGQGSATGSELSGGSMAALVKARMQKKTLNQKIARQDHPKQEATDQRVAGGHRSTGREPSRGSKQRSKCRVTVLALPDPGRDAESLTRCRVPRCRAPKVDVLAPGASRIGYLLSESVIRLCDGSLSPKVRPAVIATLVP